MADTANLNFAFHREADSISVGGILGTALEASRKRSAEVFRQGPEQPGSPHL